jgi:hypothetical protein
MLELSRKTNSYTHLSKRQLVSITVNNNFIGTASEFLFYEAKEMLLVHARGRMDVGVHLYTHNDMSLHQHTYNMNLLF